MASSRTAGRNRAILADFEAGLGIAQLAELHRLSPSSISAIITAERHKRALSPDPLYRRWRDVSADRD